MPEDTLAKELVAKLDRQKILILQIDMWRKVSDQGIAPEDVASFGFDPLLMTPEEIREAGKHRSDKLRPLDKNNPYGWPIISKDGKKVIVSLKHNYVHLRSGEKVRLTPMVDRPPPDTGEDR